jgi:DNA (cytosine-5)-methyltransferase 1
VFIDGDYWHGRQWQTRGHATLSAQFRGVHNRSYWVRKIRGNIKRDVDRTSALLLRGWRVLRFWESDIAARLDECVATVTLALDGTRARASRRRTGEKAFAEFFAGIGLVRLALERRGWRAVFSNDIDPQKHEMYAHNFRGDPPGQYHLGDVRELRGTDVPDIALATASFPCTDLSLAGRRNGLAGEQSGTLWQFLRILDEMGRRKPPLVLLENVPGFLSSHGGRDFRNALREMARLGYGCDAVMMDALWFVPQSRLRLFVIGVQEGVGPFSVAEQMGFYQSRTRPKELAQRILTEGDILWRVRSLPEPPRAEHHVEEILEEIPEDSPTWWSAERVDYLLAQMSARHRAVISEMMQSHPYHYGTVYRRMRHGRSMAELRTDGIAGCLRTPRGGSSRQILVRAGKGFCKARYMTPREYARLQGVPESYRINVPMNQALFGFGDAVCVPVVEWVAEHYLDPVMSELLRGVVLYAAGGVTRARH